MYVRHSIYVINLYLYSHIYFNKWSISQSCEYCTLRSMIHIYIIFILTFTCILYSYMHIQWNGILAINKCLAAAVFWRSNLIFLFDSAWYQQTKSHRRHHKYTHAATNSHSQTHHSKEWGIVTSTIKLYYYHHHHHNHGNCANNKTILYDSRDTYILHETLCVPQQKWSQFMSGYMHLCSVKRELIRIGGIWVVTCLFFVYRNRWCIVCGFTFCWRSWNNDNNKHTCISWC